MYEVFLKRSVSLQRGWHFTIISIECLLVCLGSYNKVHCKTAYPFA